jgi:hypothetical protein
MKKINNNEKIVMSELDNISLQLMCNKSRYNKLLSKTNPEAYNIKKIHNDKLKKYSKNILLIVGNYLSNTNNQISNDVDDAFDNFAKSCIKHIEVDKINQDTNGGCYEEDYNDDVLFEESNLDNNDDISLYNTLVTNTNVNYTLDTALYSSLDEYIQFEKIKKK